MADQSWSACLRSRFLFQRPESFLNIKSRKIWILHYFNFSEFVDFFVAKIPDWVGHVWRKNMTIYRFYLYCISIILEIEMEVNIKWILSRTASCWFLVRGSSSYLFSVTSKENDPVLQQIFQKIRIFFTYKTWNLTMENQPKNLAFEAKASSSLQGKKTTFFEPTSRMVKVNFVMLRIF